MFIVAASVLASLLVFAGSAEAAGSVSCSGGSVPFSASEDPTCTSSGSVSSCTYYDGTIPPIYHVLRPGGSEFAWRYHAGSLGPLNFDASGTWTHEIFHYSGPNCINKVIDYSSTFCVDLAAPAPGWSQSIAYKYWDGGAFWYDASMTASITRGTDASPSCGNAGNQYTSKSSVCTWGSPSTSQSYTSGQNVFCFGEYDTAGNWGSNYVYISLDLANPTASVPAQSSLCTNNGLGGWCKSSFSVTGSRDDAIPSSGIASSTCTSTTTPPQGTSTRSCTATDNVGRTGTSATQTYKIDPNAPSNPSINLPGCAQNGGWCNAAQSITLGESSDGTGVSGVDFSGVANRYYKIGTGADTAYTTAFTVSSSNTIYSWAVDSAGNSGRSSWSSASIQIDTSAPTVQIAIPSSCTGSNWCQSAWIDFTISDAQSGIASSTCTGTPSCDDQYISETGQHQITATATNNAGTTTGPVGPQTANVDSTAPTATIDARTCGATSGWHGDWCAGSVTLSGSGSDGAGQSGLASGYPKCTDNGATVSCSAATVSGQGDHTYRVEARDKAGKSAEPAVTTFSIDTGAPTVSISNPPAGSWQSGGFYVDFSASDTRSGLDRCEYTVTGSGTSGAQPVGCYDGSVYIDVGSYCTTQGSNTCSVEVKAFDAAGNSGKASRPFSIDLTAPTTVMTQNPTESPSGWYSTDVSFTFTCTDNVGGSGCSTQYSLDGGAWTSAGSKVVNTAGPHTLSYRAVDVAGNQEAARSATVNIDKTAPTTAITCPAAGSTQSPGFTVCFSDADTGGSQLASCQYRAVGKQGSLDTFDSGWQDRSCGGSVSVSAGPFETSGCRVVPIAAAPAGCRIESRAFDNAGNQSPVATRTVSIA